MPLKDDGILSINREVGNKHHIAIALKDLGAIAQSQDDYKRATSLLEESLVLSREIGDKQIIAYALVELSVVVYRQGAYRRAEALLEESLFLNQDRGDKWNMIGSLGLFAMVACSQGHHERAARLFGAEEALQEAIGAPRSEYTEQERDLAAMRAGLGEEKFAKVWAEGRAMTLEQAIAYVMKPE